MVFTHTNLCKYKKLRSLDYRPLKFYIYKLVFFVFLNLKHTNWRQEKENISSSIHHHREKDVHKREKIYVVNAPCLAHTSIVYLYKETLCGMIVASKRIWNFTVIKEGIKLELHENTLYNGEAFNVSGWVAFIYIFHFFSCKERANKWAP